VSRARNSGLVSQRSALGNRPASAAALASPCWSSGSSAGNEELRTAAVEA
jgi:hypothetical protein